jgi:LPXTG-motif cell wall-anchored protein
VHSRPLLAPPYALMRVAAYAAAASLVLAGALVIGQPAHAVGSLTVNSTADAAVSDCETITVPPSPLTLRAALCVANNTDGAVEVIVPSGNYRLSAGALVIGTRSGAAITVTGASRTVIVGDGSHQVMALDPRTVGGVAVTIDTVTITGGVDTLYGGGAIIGGAGLGSADSLTVKHSTIKDNATSADNSPGGGIQFIGGSLTVTDSTFSGNLAGASNGGAIAYQAQGTGTQSLTIRGSTFTGNSSGPSNGTQRIGGGAIVVDGLTSNAPMSITSSTFSGNVAQGAAASAGVGGAIYLSSGALTVSESTITGNGASGTDAVGSAIMSTGATLTAQYNRIAGNTGAASVGVESGNVQASLNWWGCNGGPGDAGCGTVAGVAPSGYSPSLALRVSAAPATIVTPATTSTVTADLLVDSAGGAVDPSRLGAFNTAPVTWLATASGSVAPGSTVFDDGVAATTLTSKSASSTTVTATVDAAVEQVQVAVSGPLGATPPNSGPGGSGTGGSGPAIGPTPRSGQGAAIANTGLPENVPLFLMLGIGVVGVGIVLLFRRRQFR